jgi:hypothetical protein
MVQSCKHDVNLMLGTLNQEIQHCVIILAGLSLILFEGRNSDHPYCGSLGALTEDQLS